MSERSTAFIVQRSTKTVLEAILIDGISQSDVSQAQEAWRPFLKKSSVEHAHWDWNQKYQHVLEAPLAYRMFGLEVAGEIQGLMLVLMTGKFCQIGIQKGKLLMYVDYLATAPWNSADLIDEPRYAGVGKVLIRAAIQLSMEEGLNGCIGLHALPKAESYYRDTCKMTDLGPDKSYQGLRYFETTPEQSTAFMRG